MNIKKRAVGIHSYYASFLWLGVYLDVFSLGSLCADRPFRSGEAGLCCYGARFWLDIYEVLASLVP